jgi:formiminoglutamase
MAVRPVDASILAKGSAEDPRLGSRLVDEGWDVAIVGCADHAGVNNSGGRTGAALGPTAIRRWLYRQTTGMEGELEAIRLHDAGDVLPGRTIEETHEALEGVVSRLAGRGPVVFLGGGHDLAYASHSGLLEELDGDVDIVNIDAHLDVRPLKDGRTITSGTPFRRVVERWGARVASLVELGVQSQHCARSHAEWVRANRGRIVPLEALRRDPVGELGKAIGGAGKWATVSLDLDAVIAAAAPGVSAPVADGLMPSEVAAMCEAAGRSAKVRLLDVVEHAPPHDENEKTSRLAALCVWRFLAGVTRR